MGSITGRTPAGCITNCSNIWRLCKTVVLLNLRNAITPFLEINFTLFVLYVALPGPPIEVKISEVTAASVHLSWSHSTPADLQYYVIQYKPRLAHQAYTEISGIITQYYTVRNLSPYTEYEFYVIAVNNLGRGPLSSAAVVTTGETGE